MYLYTPKVLVHRGQLKMTHVMYKVNVNYSALEKHFALLIEQGLIEAKIVGNEEKSSSSHNAALQCSNSLMISEKLYPIRKNR